jgi:N-acetylglucosamine-6-phosphate deacetylase
MAAEHHNFKVKNGLEVAGDTTLSGSLTINNTTVTRLLDSADVTAIAQAASLDSAEALQILLDSSEIIQLIDSDYVTARAPSGGDGGIAMAIALG